MKTTTSILKERSQKSWEKAELGVVWAKGDDKRFYFSNEVSEFISGKMHNNGVNYGDVFIDLNSGSYGCSKNYNFSDEDMNLFEHELMNLLSQLKENYGKKIKSNWSGKIQKCDSVLFFI